MKLGEPDLTQTYRILLSSGDDALGLRDRVDGLVRESINSQLIETGQRVRVEVDRWERTATQRIAEDEQTIEVFVRRALRSHMTLALLLELLGDGTWRGLEAVLETDKEINAVWFIPGTTDPDTPVGTFLRERGGISVELISSRTGVPRWNGGSPDNKYGGPSLADKRLRSGYRLGSPVAQTRLRPMYRRSPRLGRSVDRAGV